MAEVVADRKCALLYCVSILRELFGIELRDLLSKFLAILRQVRIARLATPDFLQWLRQAIQAKALANITRIDTQAGQHQDMMFRRDSF